VFTHKYVADVMHWHNRSGMLYPQFEGIRRKTLAAVLTALNGQDAEQGTDKEASVMTNNTHVDLKEGQAVELEVIQKGPLG
jgi:hypothetical protein